MTSTNSQRSSAIRPWVSRVLDALVIAACAAFSLAFAGIPERRGSPAPDFAVLDTQVRKQAFFDYLRPLIAEVNERARSDRDFVGQMADRLALNGRLSAYERIRIQALTARYEVPVEGDAGMAAVIESLQRRTGTVPVSLALVQAAKESGWGTSRFAVEGNNLFGQRCYDAGCGIRPHRQSGDAGWNVARYDSIRDSLYSYLMNLNTHPEYRGFRAERQRMRQHGESLDGIALAAALDAYSERGADYVGEIQAMIRQNSLE